ncbi:MAG: ribose ABC transporter permease [Rhodospirillales bacterium]
MSAVAQGAPAQRHPLVRLLRDPLLWLIVAIVVIGAASSPYFLTPLNIANTIRNAAAIGLLSLGMTMVLLTGRIDLSVAATMVFSVIVGVVVTVEIGALLGERWLVRGNSFAGPPGLVIAVTLLTGLIVGIVNGIGVAYLKVASFIMTLVALTALRGLNYILTTGHPFYLKGETFNFIGDSVYFGIPTGFLIALVVLAVMLVFLRGTVAGRRFYAIGGNEYAALYAGIKTARYVVLAFAISGLCAAIAGVVLTSRLKSVDAPLASGYELTAIAIAVIAGVSLAGGVGSPLRALLASLAFAGALNLFGLWGVSTWYQNLAIGFVLLLAVGLSQARRRFLEQRRTGGRITYAWILDSWRGYWNDKRQGFGS